MDQVRSAIRARHYSVRTEETYAAWIRRFIVCQGKRHPETMGEAEVGAFLTFLATEKRVSASTQNQALAALLFLYRNVLGRRMDWVEPAVRAKRPLRLPVVLTRGEVSTLLGALQGTEWLVASLLYGAGLRLSEALCLRVKDVDFTRNEILVRDGKGRRDRVTMLPQSVKEPLIAHLRRVKELNFIRGISLRVRGACSCPTPSTANTQTRIMNGDGNTLFLLRAGTWSARAVCNAVITCTRL